MLWHLFGRNTSQRWDDSYKSDYPVKPMPPAGNAALTESEIRTFVEWVDLGALWSGIPEQEPPTGPSPAMAPKDVSGRKPSDAAGGM